MKIQHAFRLGLVGTLGVGLGILIISSIVSLSTILTYIGAALFIALGLEPAIIWLERRKFPRWAAILTVLLIVSGVIVGLIFAVVPIITDQVSQFIGQIPAIVQRIQTQDWIGGLNKQFGSKNVQNVLNSITAFVTDPNKLTSVAGGILSVGFSIVSGLFGAVIIAILTLYFTASLNSIKRAMYQLIPASRRERFADLSEQISQSVGRYVIGQVALASCNGVLSFAFLSLIKAPFPAVLAFVAFVFSLVPLVGTLSGSVIIVLVCLIPGIGSPLTALVAAIYYLIYMQVEAYLLSPNIMRRAVSVPGALVVIAALAGGSLLGILGALIAIPVAASILLIIKQVVIPRQNEL
jgi:predicted PurR-regulated permease PerM